MRPAVLLILMLYLTPCCTVGVATSAGAAPAAAEPPLWQTVERAPEVTSGAVDADTPMRDAAEPRAPEVTPGAGDADTPMRGAAEPPAPEVPPTGAQFACEPEQCC